MSAIVNKVCVGCGMDVAGQRRVKDDAGRYYCHPCFTRAKQKATPPPEDDLPVLQAAEPADEQPAENKALAVKRRRVLAIAGAGTGVLLLSGLSIFLIAGRGKATSASAVESSVPVALTPLQSLLNAAQAGDATAMTKLATMYESGQGANANPVEAQRWWRAAAAKEQPNAMFKAAMMHLTGERADQSLSEFVRLATGAAERGNVEAMNALVVFYEQDGNPDDRIENAPCAARVAARVGEPLHLAAGRVRPAGKVAPDLKGVRNNPHELIPNRTRTRVKLFLQPRQWP